MSLVGPYVLTVWAARMVAAFGSQPEPDATTLIPCPLPPSGSTGGITGSGHLPAGAPAPRRWPAPEAQLANRRGSEHYRAHALAAAEAAFRQAVALDPGFFTPRLNLAAVLARQGRHAEAFVLVDGLVEEAYVPWAREVDTTADLAVLRTQPEWPRHLDVRRQAAQRWGEGVARGLLLVARTGPALKTGWGAPSRTSSYEQVFVLAPRQEIFSFRPDTGGWQQVTAEDGRIVGFAEAPGGHTLLYARAEKLVRRSGAPPGLRGVTVRLLRLPTMTLGPPIVLRADPDTANPITALTLGFVRQAGTTLPWVAVERAPAGQADSSSYVVQETRLLPWSGAAPTHPVRVFGAPRSTPVRGRFEVRFPHQDAAGKSVTCSFVYSEEVRGGVPVVRLDDIRFGSAKMGGRRPGGLLHGPAGVGRFSLPVL